MDHKALGDAFAGGEIAGTGHALIVIVFLHMLRVFLSSAYRGPRHLNWIIGLG